MSVQRVADFVAVLCGARAGELVPCLDTRCDVELLLGQLVLGSEAFDHFIVISRDLGDCQAGGRLES